MFVLDNTGQDMSIPGPRLFAAAFYRLLVRVAGSRARVKPATRTREA
ncbi:hypothetical protein QF026_006435 [Streptomyces aurantiacus]|nr:hypothetical protein [Streptomyces aurantiacus]MDQ0777969.1 hypothetical protein [Streptomyces aurantiacus]